jgi:hypothetical protein
MEVIYKTSVCVVLVSVKQGNTGKSRLVCSAVSKCVSSRV